MQAVLKVIFILKVLDDRLLVVRIHVAVDLLDNFVVAVLP